MNLQQLIHRLNSDEVEELIRTLDELYQDSELLRCYIQTSPFAFELIRIWNETQLDALETQILKTFTRILSDPFLQASCKKLAWNLLKIDKNLDRIRKSLEKTDTTIQVLILEILCLIIKLDAGLSREIQLKFDLDRVYSEDVSRVNKIESKRSSKKTASIDFIHQEKYSLLFNICSNE